ncbi:MAG: hypothetical protein J6B95_09650 [Oscillospiraceae bacterium]|nr:hypothetical protein [Oscillospiraceae bacterium]
MIEKYIQALKNHALADLAAVPDGESLLGILYECHNENHPYDNDQIKADFHALYEKMNGMPLREMDQIIYPVCTLSAGIMRKLVLQQVSRLVSVWRQK